MPVRGLLVGLSYPQHQGFLEWGSHYLQAQRHSLSVQSHGQGEGRQPTRIGRGRIDREVSGAPRWKGNDATGVVGESNTTTSPTLSP